MSAPFSLEFFTAAIIADVDAAADEATALTGLAIETDAKKEAPVRGGYRSFAPAIAGKGGQQIGGTLRRSYTTASPGSEGNPAGGGNAFANVRDGGLLVGSWIGYAYFVDRGTTRMAARPHFDPAVQKHIPQWQKRFEDSYARRKG